MGKKVLSIELGNSTTRVCLMDYKKKNPRVYYHLVLDTPDNSIQDGYLLKPEEIAAVIKNSLAENQIKGTKDVIFTIASTKIVTREQMLPQMKSNALDSLIQTNLNEYFPIDLSNYEVTHTVLGQVLEGKDAGKQRVMILAAEKDLVGQYRNLAKLCGLNLIELDQVGNSIYQIIRQEDAASCKMVFKIEEEATNITVIKGDSLLLQRNIGFGIEAAVQEVMAQPAFAVRDHDSAWDLMSRKICIKDNLGDMDVSGPSKFSDDAEDLKKSEGMEGQAFVKAREEVTDALEDLIKGLQRVYNYYNSTNAGNPVDTILVCGAGGHISGLSKLIGNELGVPTKMLRKLEAVHYHVLGDDADLYNYVACIGATFAPVGFYSEQKEKKEKHKTNYASASILVAILTLVVVGTGITKAVLDYKTQENDNRDLKATEARYLESEKVYLKNQDVMAFYQQVQEGVQLTEKPSNSIVKFLEELERNLPATATVSQFSSNDEAFAMMIQVNTKDEAAGVIDKMRTFESLSDVSVSVINEIREELSEMSEEEKKEAEQEGAEVTEITVTQVDPVTKNISVLELPNNIKGYRTGIYEMEEDADGKEKYFRNYVEFTVTCTYKFFEEEAEGTAK